MYFIFYIFFHFGFFSSIFPQLFSVEANIPFLLKVSSKSALQVFLISLKFCTIVVFPIILPVSAHTGFYLPVHNKKSACTPLRGTGRFLPNFILGPLPRIPISNCVLTPSGKVHRRSPLRSHRAGRRQNAGSVLHVLVVGFDHHHTVDDLHAARGRPVRHLLEFLRLANGPVLFLAALLKLQAKQIHKVVPVM